MSNTGLPAWEASLKAKYEARKIDSYERDALAALVAGIPDVELKKGLKQYTYGTSEDGSEFVLLAVFQYPLGLNFDRYSGERAHVVHELSGRVDIFLEPLGARVSDLMIRRKALSKIESWIAGHRNGPGPRIQFRPRTHPSPENLKQIQRWARTETQRWSEDGEPPDGLVPVSPKERALDLLLEEL